MFEVSLDVHGIRETQAYLSDVQDALNDLTELHEWFIIAIQSYIQKNWPTSPGLSSLTVKARARGGSRVLFDTGKLWRSVTGTGPDSAAEATAKWARLTVRHEGATTHQYGAIIRPRRAKFLAVPLSPDASKAGSPRGFGKELTLIPFKNRRGYLMVEKPRKTGKGRHRARQIGGRERQQTKAHFMLTKEVRIPPRPFVPELAAVMPDIDDATNRFLAMITGDAA